MKGWVWAVIIGAVLAVVGLIVWLLMGKAKGDAAASALAGTPVTKGDGTPTGAARRLETGLGGAVVTIEAPSGFATEGPGWLLQSSVEGVPGGYYKTKTEAVSVAGAIASRITAGEFGDTAGTEIRALRPMAVAWSFRRLPWKADEVRGKVIADELALYDEYANRTG